MRWFWETRVQPWWTVTLPGWRRARQARHGPSLAFASAASATFARITPGASQATPPAPEPILSGRVDADPEAITAILTVYSRGEYLEEQVRALREQTHPPAEIWVWCNDAGHPIVDRSELVDRVVVCNANFKFWGRFALATLARTPYVAIYDDDVLPEPRWHENCLATYRAGVEGVLGGCGVLLPAEGGYSSRRKVGWNGRHSETVTEVDLVQHAWMFPRRLVQALWAETPPTWENGEDIHLGWMVRKHFGLSSWVPPHPEADRSMWSCRPAFGKRVSRTGLATHKGEGHHAYRDAIVDAHRADGWSILAERGDPAA